MGAISLNVFVMTQAYTITPGTAAAPVAGEVATGGAAGYGNAALATGQVESAFPVSLQKGMSIMLDSGTPSALYSALNTAGVIRAATLNDSVGRAALSN
jgi:hypothetical protein